MAEHVNDEIVSAREPRDPGETREPRRTRLVAWTTLGVLAATAAAGGVYAATLGGSPAASAASGLTAAAASAPPSAKASPAPGSHAGRGGKGGPGGIGGPGGFGGFGGIGGFGGMGGFGGLGGVLHGEATVATKGGGVVIVDTQRGTISAIDTAAGTVTVTSSDKVAFSYQVDAKTQVVDFAAATPRKATITDLKVGDTVQITATRSGDTRTATLLVDGQPAPKARPTAAPPKHPGHGWPGGPRPSASPSASAASA